MSSYFLIKIECDLSLSIPMELIDNIKSGLPSKERALRNFPGWSGERLDLVEKWEGYKVYRYSSCREVHEDVFIDDWYESVIPFLKKLAEYSLTQGFIGYIESSDDYYPSLIYFNNHELVVWKITNANSFRKGKLIFLPSNDIMA